MHSTLLNLPVHKDPLPTVIVIDNCYYDSIVCSVYAFFKALYHCLFATAKDSGMKNGPY